MSPWLGNSLTEHADVVLPIGTFAETSGTFVNAQGDWQSFPGVVQPVGEARPAWKVLRVLGNLLKAQGFDYQSSEAVLEELRNLEPGESGPSAAHLDAASAVSVRASDLDVPMYSIDPLVRRAESLQLTQDAAPGWRESA